jgi:peptidoglycan hydrolase-like protein with peptidoglycan-binding domain
MAKIIKLKESDLKKLVTQAINEQFVDKPLKLGDRGDKVIELQNKLKLIGVNLGKSGPNKDGVDGRFGELTKKALQAIQARFKLPQTGMYDQQTKNYIGQFSTPDLGNIIKPQKQVTKTNATPTQVKKTEQVINKEKEVAKKITGTVSVLDPNASLLFNGSQLQWLANGGVVKSWNGISGLTWKNTPPSDWGELAKSFYQTPEEWSKDPNAGPLPPGQYTVNPVESRKSGTGDVSFIESLRTLWQTMTGGVVSDKQKQFQADTNYSRISWGNFRAAIIPSAKTETFGRSSFYIHGGKFAGSHGCIDLTDEMEDFAKFYGTWMASTKKNSIPLTVNYGNSKNNFFSKFYNGLKRFF